MSEITAEKRSRVERLADAILADRNRIAPTRENIVTCFVCQRGMIYRGQRGDLNGRFCSLRCREWYDAGNAPLTEQKISYRWRDGRPMQETAKGFRIPCANCKRDFESLGLRCCSADCERRSRERKDNLAVMAEVGMEPAAKKVCAAPGCGAVIPKWRKGRKVSSTTRFCSPKCAQKVKRALGSPGTDLSAETIKKCPPNGPVSEAVEPGAAAPEGGAPGQR
jgi:hypothetical protein